MKNSKTNQLRVNTRKLTSKNTKYLKKYKVLILRMSLLKYTNTCIGCDKEFKTDRSWKEQCKPCYLLHTYPDKYKVCPECDEIKPMKDYPRCYECTQTRKKNSNKFFEQTKIRDNSSSD